MELGIFETSDKRVHKVEEELIYEPGADVAACVLAHILAEDGSHFQSFKVNYFPTFIERRRFQREQLLSDTRAEIIIFLEGDHEDWEEHEPSLYVFNKR